MGSKPGVQEIADTVTDPNAERKHDAQAQKITELFVFRHGAAGSQRAGSPLAPLPRPVTVGSI